VDINRRDPRIDMHAPVWRFAAPIRPRDDLTIEDRRWIRAAV
jgi:hypothetical protein